MATKAQQEFLLGMIKKLYQKQAYDVEPKSLQSRPRNYNWETTLDV